MKVNLNQLRCFYLAAKYKSISKAADALFVTPPAITMQIKKFEESLGFRLLCREGNTIRSTRDAENLFSQAENIFKEVEKFEVQLEQLTKNRKGELIIGSHYIPAKYIMPKLVEQIKHFRPQLNIKVVLDAMPQLIQRVQNHDLHFVLSVNPPQCPKINSLHLFTEDIVLVALQGSKHIVSNNITVNEIKDLPLLLPENNTGLFQIISDYFENAGVSPCIVMDNLSADVSKNFILQDMGTAFLARFCVQELLEKGQLQEIHIREGGPVANMNLAFLAEKNLSPGVQALISLLEEKSFKRSELVVSRERTSPGSNL